MKKPNKHHSLICFGCGNDLDFSKGSSSIIGADRTIFLCHLCIRRIRDHLNNLLKYVKE